MTAFADSEDDDEVLEVVLQQCVVAQGQLVNSAIEFGRQFSTNVGADKPAQQLLTSLVKDEGVQSRKDFALISTEKLDTLSDR